MLHAFASLSPFAILIVAFIGFGIGALACTVVSTFTLAALIAAHHSPGPMKGAELGLLFGAGLVAARQGTNALFEGRTPRHFLIVAGHDVALCVIQGALLGAWH